MAQTFEYSQPSVDFSAKTRDERREFLKKTYLTLSIAIGAFALACFIMVTSGIGESMFWWSMRGQALQQLLMLGGFIGIGVLSQKWAFSQASPQLQYLGLMVGAIGYAFFFTPMLYMAAHYVQDGTQLIAKAGIITGFVFAGLTGTVYFSKKDFSFLRGAISAGMFLAMGLIVVATIFGLNLGAWFSAAMVALMAGWR